MPVHAFGYEGLDHLTFAQADRAAVIRLFDSMGQLLRESFDGRTFERAYDDLAGQLVLRYPDLREETHSWDLLGRVEKPRRCQE